MRAGVKTLSGRERGGVAGVLALTALTAVLEYGGAPHVATFLVAAAALAALAWIVSLATEQVGERFGPAITGVLQSTLGNLPEFFVVVFALSAGEVVVAQTSLIGSIFANALLVLGAVIVAGARESKDGVMRFGHRLPQDASTLLLLAVFSIVLVSLSAQSSDRASTHIGTLSAIGAGAILLVYVAWVAAYLRGDSKPEGGGAESGRVPLAVSLTLLGAGGVASAFVSDWFISALTPAVATLHLSKAFAGLVIVAIAGNAVENVTGVVLASKGQADLAISVVKNSVAQVAAFLFPALVLVSLAFSSTLTFALAPVYAGALFLTAIVVWQITGDGRAAMFEGLALIALYVVLAAFTLYE